MPEAPQPNFNGEETGGDQNSQESVRDPASQPESQQDIVNTDEIAVQQAEADLHERQETPTEEQQPEEAINPEEEEGDDEEFFDSSSTRLATHEEIEQVASQSPEANKILSPDMSLTKGDLVVKEVALESSKEEPGQGFSTENLTMAKEKLKDRIKLTEIRGQLGDQDQENFSFIEFLRILFEDKIDVPAKFHNFDEKQKNLYAYDRWVMLSDPIKKEITDNLSRASKEYIPNSSLTKLSFEQETFGIPSTYETCMSLHSKIQNGVLRPRLCFARKIEDYQSPTEEKSGLANSAEDEKPDLPMAA